MEPNGEGAERIDDRARRTFLGLIGRLERAEVKNAHDRHANIDAAYLLQKTEWNAKESWYVRATT